MNAAKTLGLCALLLLCSTAQAQQSQTEKTEMWNSPGATSLTVSNELSKWALTAGAPKEVLRIQMGGRIFWNGREVESDDEFRRAMLDVRDYLANQWCGPKVGSGR